MTYTDTMGYAVSTTSSEALAAYEQGVSLWLRAAQRGRRGPGACCHG